MSIPGNSINSVRGHGPMMVRGVGVRHMATQFKSQVMFSDKSYTISGVTLSSSGAVIANCLVELYYTIGDIPICKVLSDGSGNFSFKIGPNLSCYIVAYKAGVLDAAGTTVNTLVGA